MIRGLAWLLACQAAGEVIVRLLLVDIPGAVVGMMLLFLGLQWRRPDDAAPVFRAADGLLDHLQLLFVPAGVGIVAYAGRLRDDALPISIAMVGSWALGLLLVGWTAQRLGRRPRAAREEPHG